MKSNNQLTILGLSEATLCMLFEAIYHLYSKDKPIQIVKNIPYSPKLPFATPNANYSIFEENEVDFSKTDYCLLGVFRAIPKKKVFEYFKKKHNIHQESYTNLVYPNAVLASTVKLKKGIFINPNVVIAPFAQIGNFVSINRGVSIGHHTHIDDFSTLNPACNVSGNCSLGEGVTVGVGANIIDGINIGANTIVGAGSLVTKDLPANVVAYGSPAKIIRSLKT